MTFSLSQLCGTIIRFIFYKCDLLPNLTHLGSVVLVYPKIDLCCPNFGYSKSVFPLSQNCLFILQNLTYDKRNSQPAQPTALKKQADETSRSSSCNITTKMGCLHLFGLFGLGLPVCLMESQLLDNQILPNQKAPFG